MAKMKTHKGLHKRVKITAGGKIKHKRSGGSHLMSTKTGQTVRQLRRDLICSKAITKRLERVLHVRLQGRP